MKKGLITFALIAGTAITSLAAPPPPPSGPNCWPPPCTVPIDGGISLLLLAGVAYGGKRAYNAMKQDPE